jgi:hypothetical protein
MGAREYIIMGAVAGFILFMVWTVFAAINSWRKY